MEKNSTAIIDKSYFRKLASRDHEEISKYLPYEYDDSTGTCLLSVWGDQYIIHLDEFKIECVTKTSHYPDGLFFLFIIFYLVHAKGNTIKEEWISEKDMPGGATFFRGPHKIPTHLIARQFNNDIKAFGERCVELGGVELDLADAAYRFEIVPCIPVAVLMWQGDEDFPPEAKILYDKTIMEYLTFDIIFSLAVEICARVGCVTSRE